MSFSFSKSCTAFAVAGSIILAQFVTFKPFEGSQRLNQNSLSTSLQFGTQKANANSIDVLSADGVNIKLIKKYKDGSEIHEVNGKKIKVSKKQIEMVTKEYMSINRPSGVSTQALPYFGSIAAAVAYMQAYASVWSWSAAIFLTRACAAKPDGCASVIIGAFQGAGWARNQIKQWSTGRY
jgi:hypothetical protein